MLGVVEGVQRGGLNGSSLLASQTTVIPHLSNHGFASQTAVLPLKPRFVPLLHESIFLYPLPSSSPGSGGERGRVLWTMVRDFKASRVEFWRRAYGFVDSGQPVDLVVWALRESSLRHYESIWKAFQRFSLTQRDKHVSLDLVLRFFG